MRSVASAFTLFCLTLLGIGGGPTLVGFLSDYFAATDPQTSPRRALETMLILNALSLICLFMASLGYRRDVERARRLDS